MAECRYCPAKVLWVKTIFGKAMPIDAEPDGETPVVYTDGNIEDTGRTASGRYARQVPVVRVVPAGSADGLWKSHFATCTSYVPEKRT